MTTPQSRTVESTDVFEAIERAERAVDDLCSGKLRWEMRVPAEPDHDPDLIISKALVLAKDALEAAAKEHGLVIGEEELEISGSLTERRAEFVYEGARIAAAAALAPIIPEPWGDRDEAFRSQFLKVIERQCGPDRSESPADLHADWVHAYETMGWRYGQERNVEQKTHPDMVSYADLGQLERDKDAVFVALCEIARQWIYEPESRR